MKIDNLTDKYKSLEVECRNCHTPLTYLISEVDGKERMTVFSCKPCLLTTKEHLTEDICHKLKKRKEEKVELERLPFNGRTINVLREHPINVLRETDEK